MAIRQLSVFLANEAGSLNQVTNILAEANVDLRSMCIADTSDYGIVRMIADNPDLAKKVLNEKGYTAQVRFVTAFAAPDQPGGLAKVLDILGENGINIEYMYALITKTVGKFYAVMRTDDEDKAEQILRDNGIELLNENEI